MPVMKTPSGRHELSVGGGLRLHVADRDVLHHAGGFLLLAFAEVFNAPPRRTKIGVRTLSMVMSEMMTSLSRRRRRRGS